MTHGMQTIFLSLGSNIEPQKNIPACLEILKKEFRVKKISSIYETDPVGPRGDLRQKSRRIPACPPAGRGPKFQWRKKFWNAAAAIETDLDAKRLTEKLRRIEERLGRRRDPADKFAPRTIDIDILLYDQRQMSTPKLTIPHPRMLERDFVMMPLKEIAPALTRALIQRQSVKRSRPCTSSKA